MTTMDGHGLPGSDKSPGERATKRLKMDDSRTSQPSGADASTSAAPNGGRVNGSSEKPSETAAPEPGTAAVGGAEITMTDAQAAPEGQAPQPATTGTEMAKTNNASEPSKDARDRGGGVAPVKAELVLANPPLSFPALASSI